MNVLQINKYYWPHIGGIETVIKQTAEGLCERVSMQVLVCSDCPKTIHDCVNGVSVTRASRLFAYGSMPISFSFFYHFIKMSKKADILHIHMPFPLADFACWLSNYKGKVVVWWHSDVVRQKFLLSLYAPLLKWLLRRADTILVATEGHIDGSSYLPEFRQKCRVIPFGVDPSLVKRSKQVLAQKDKAKKDCDPLRFLFIGRLVHYKGIDTLLDALSMMKQTNFTIKLIGDGLLRKQLIKRVEQAGLAEKVVFLGTANDEQVNSELENCDAFVFPSISKNEAFGLVQLDAMIFAKPVINTSLPGGVPRVALHNHSALTVEPGNAIALAQAMDSLIVNPGLRQRLGQNGRQRVLEHFMMQTMLDRIYDVYNELLLTPTLKKL